MSLDAQTKTYRQHRPRSNLRTTYALQNVWYGLKKQERADAQRIQRSTSCLERNDLTHYKLSDLTTDPTFDPQSTQVPIEQLRQSANLSATKSPLFSRSCERGRVYGGWQNLREVLQAKGRRIVFIDGMRRIENTHRGGVGPMDRNPISPTLTRRMPTFNNKREIFAPAKEIDPFNMQSRTRKFVGKSYNLAEKQAAESGNWNVMR